MIGLGLGVSVDTKIVDFGPELTKIWLLDLAIAAPNPFGNLQPYHILCNTPCVGDSRALT